MARDSDFSLPSIATAPVESLPINVLSVLEDLTARASSDDGLIGTPDFVRAQPVPAFVEEAPDVTEGAFASWDPLTNSSLPGTPYWLETDDPALEYSGGKFILYEDQYPYYIGTNDYQYFAGVVLPISSSYRVSFETDADVLELIWRNAVSSEVWVDGKPVDFDWSSLTSDGTNHYIKLTFANKAPQGRLIECRMQNQAWWGGVIVPTYASVWLPRRPLGPRVMGVGDSVAAGSNADGSQHGYMNRAAQLLGWHDFWNSALGGVGFVNDGSGAYETFTEYVPHILPYIDPDIILFAGAGRNDMDPVYYGNGQLYDAIVQTFASCHAFNPKIQLIITGPSFPNNAPGAGGYAVRDIVQQAAADYGVPFIDQFGGATSDNDRRFWITGTGREGSETGSGNADFYLSSDTAHPTDDGHAYMAARLASGIARLLPLAGTERPSSRGTFTTEFATIPE